MTQKDIITLIIAGYAALISTLVFIWNVVNTIRDKGKIRVTGFFGFTTNIYDNPYEVLYYEFVNYGTKAVYLAGFGGDFTKKIDGMSRFLINVPGLPKKLEPGDLHQAVFENFESIDVNVRRLYAYDSIGNKFYMKRKTLRKLIRDKDSIRE